MAGLSGFQWIWIGSAAIVTIGWLICSFTDPSPRRAILEWFCASVMYVGLLTLFVSLSMRAQASGNTFALVAFLFLCALFGGGLLVSLWHTIGAFGGEKKTGASAIN